MLLLGGATETAHEGIGGFQEWPQLESVRAAVKFAARPAAVELVPRQLERAVRTAVYGRPGPTYVDLPGDLLNTRVPASSVSLGPAPAPPPVSAPRNPGDHGGGAAAERGQAQLQRHPRGAGGAQRARQAAADAGSQMGTPPLL